MRMVRWMILWAAAGLMGAAASGWAEAGAQTVIGTITALTEPQSGEEKALYSCELRVDQVKGEEAKAQAGEAIAVRWERQQVPARLRLGLGDQIQVALGSAEGGAGGRLVEGEVVYLGRGEFLNPGQHPSLDLGSPQARVLVKMFAPLQSECHLKTAELLRGIAAQDPQRVRVQIFDVYQPAAREEMSRERLTCATVLVNNRYEFTLKGEGEARKVQLWHRPNTPTSSYSSEDAAAVVEQEAKRVYSPPPLPCSSPTEQSSTPEREEP